MADTIGDMIDKLTIANIRLWMLEDSRREFCKTEEKGQTKDEAISFLNKVSKTNRERNSLIDQINASLRVLVDKAANKESTFSISAEQLLGCGKNKFYKTEDK